jgi:adenylate kinase
VLYIRVRLVLLGPPGSGKGTQGRALATRYGVPLVSSGDVMRRIAASDTERGRRLREYLERGDLAPDDLVVGEIDAALRNADGGRGYVLDGFPRTEHQAHALASTNPPDVAVYLDVPDDVARRRLLGRIAAGRADDASTAAVDRRFARFHEQIDPILDFYGQQHRLQTVDANQPAESVTTAIEDAVAAASRE